jgi:hypothetical protein
VSSGKAGGSGFAWRRVVSPWLRAGEIGKVLRLRSG